MHKVQVDKDHYKSNYDSKERFASYWHQIDELRNLNPDSVLEVGIGSGFVSNYLKRRDMDITTLDFDERLNPDKVGSVLNIPFPNNAFDVVACFQVLEHLPYENFSVALSEIYRVSKKYAVISLPDCTRTFSLSIKIPGLKMFRRLIRLPRFKTLIHQFNGQHYWEIGKADYTLRQILRDINDVGFRLMKTYRLFEHPYHRLIVLMKQ